MDIQMPNLNGYEATAKFSIAVFETETSVSG